MKRVEIWRSLRTDSFATALKRLPSVSADLIAEIERARSEAGLTVDETLVRPCPDDATRQSESAGAPPTTSESPTPLTLAEVYRRYIDDPTRAWSSSTREAYETIRKLAIAVLGANTPVVALSRVHCRDLLDVLRFLPANASKRYPKLTPRAAAELARTQGDIKTISAANANSLMSNMSSFLNWCVAEELMGRNPARGLRLPDPVAKRDKRCPFSKDQLHAIFNAPLYRGCTDGDRGYAKPGNELPRGARFWVPLIALHTGARLGEICQLDTSDIRCIDSVHCFVITQRSLVGSKDKHLKTSASDRTIPVHPTLETCGFLAFVAAKRREGALKLFDDIDVGDTASRAVAFSKWFTQFQRSCGAQRSRTSFHSFRHNFRDELRTARIDHDIAMLLGGWTSPSSRGAVHENYGSGYRADALNEAVCKLRFADVDVRHLAMPQQVG